jgi:citrate synthase
MFADRFDQPAVFRPVTAVSSRNYASIAEPDLKTTLRECIPAKRELLKKVKAHSGKVIGDVKIENTLGGMR